MSDKLGIFSITIVQLPLRKRPFIIENDSKLRTETGMVAAIRTAHTASAEGFVPAEFTKEQVHQMVICTEPAKRIIYNHFRKKLWSHLRIDDAEWTEGLAAELLIKVTISEPVESAS